MTLSLSFASSVVPEDRFEEATTDGLTIILISQLYDIGFDCLIVTDSQL
jgi:hypothetical protein